MDCPDWVPAPQRPRLERVLRDRVARDVVDDLGSASAGWDAATRSRLVERFLARAEAGAPPAAAFICALDGLLGATPDE